MWRRSRPQTTSSTPSSSTTTNSASTSPPSSVSAHPLTATNSLQKWFCHTCDKEVTVNAPPNPIITEPGDQPPPSTCSECDGEFVSLLEEEEEPEQVNATTTTNNTNTSSPPYQPPNNLSETMQTLLNGLHRAMDPNSQTQGGGIHWFGTNSPTLNLGDLIQNIQNAFQSNGLPTFVPPMVFGGANNGGFSAGDYAWGPGGLDAIISQLMEQTAASTGPPPASDEAIKALDTTKLTEQDVADATDSASFDATCYVCHDDPTVGESVTTLPCGHRYHSHCIVPWLKQRHTCPVCRYELEPGTRRPPDLTGAAAAAAAAVEATNPSTPPASVSPPSTTTTSAGPVADASQNTSDQQEQRAYVNHTLEMPPPPRPAADSVEDSQASSAPTPPSVAQPPTSEQQPPSPTGLASTSTRALDTNADRSGSVSRDPSVRQQSPSFTDEPVSSTSNAPIGGNSDTSHDTA